AGMGAMSKGRHNEKQDVVIYGAALGGLVGLGRAVFSGFGTDPGTKQLRRMTERDSTYVAGFLEGYRTEAARRKRQGAAVTAFTLAAGYMVAGILAGNWEEPSVVIYWARIPVFW
ncbi:MAG: hypothetical protein Q8N53_16840, partial [Longimicrobiales bacterium]|nr:hypothetical protein [Longimicrobiales bacterium]